MDVRFHTLHLHKRFPLRISRGTITGSDNLFVSVSDGAAVGWGEMAPGETEGAGSAAEGEAMLRDFVHDGVAEAIHDVWAAGRDAGLARCAQAALDMALWDLRAKRAGMPLWRLLGLAPRAVPTSLTIGILPPEEAAERTRIALDRGARALKIKLGAPEGVEADRAMFAAVAEAAEGSGAALRVDANGGWSPEGARAMMDWLAERGAEYVEQPLVRGAEDELPGLFRDRPLPIYADESVRVAADVPGLADRVDGVNLKLMKCGGITEAMRIVATARAHGLGTMIGCMGESSVSIAAGAALSALFDHIDLDSHLNLDPDPATGLTFADGTVIPPDRPGHGAEPKDA
jgi:muconate cycloisomerase